MTNELTKVSQENSSFIELIERIASHPSFDPQKMLDLLAMRERIIAKNAEASFNAAMARLNFPAIEQKSQIKHRESVIATYAKYEDIDEIIRPIYSAEGFFLSFDTTREDGGINVIGTLSHKDGHSKKASLFLPLDTSGSKNGVQAMGSTISYGKRYVAGMLLNFVTKKEDDDGNLGLLNPIDAASVKVIADLIKETKADEGQFLNYMKANSIEEISVKDYPMAVNALMAKKKKGGA